MGWNDLWKKKQRLENSLAGFVDCILSQNRVINVDIKKIQYTTENTKKNPTSYNYCLNIEDKSGISKNALLDSNMPEYVLL